MDILQILVTTGAICIVALVAGLLIINKIQAPTSDEPSYTQEELNNIELAQELYDKELRTTTVKKAPNKQKVAQQVEDMRKVVDAHDTLIKEIDNYDVQVPTPDPSVTTPPVTQKESKPEFPIDKPKKKRKYYPKKLKTSI
jgi:hypothetical protein